MEKRKIISLLKELRKISGEIYLFGNFKNPDQLVRIIRKRYSQIYKLSIDKGFLDTDMFKLDENSSADDISTSISLLITYMDDSEY